MTTYTTTAIATSSIDNTVSVASISNMIPGLPITFSGTTFGGITAGSTYYIGTITYGYPTSKITLTSLPGGAVFAVTTATGSMTANWADGGQQILNTTPPGENLNTAFTKINTNFDQIWAAGPVGSNIKIADNTIYTLDTNGDLVLNPNGTGNIVANADVIPDQYGIRNLGSPDRVWSEVYTLYANISNLALNSLTLQVGNFHLLGGSANYVLQTNGDGNLAWVEPLHFAGGDVNYSVQYDDNGLLNGNASFVFNPISNTVTLQNLVATGTANLNTVGNVTITGGQAGYVLQTDGTGNLSWVAPLGNTQVILDQQIQGTGNTVYTLTFPAFTNTVLVSINGVVQRPNVSYTVNNEIITFTEPLITSDVADVRFLVGGQAGNGQPGGANGSIQFNMGDGFGGTANLTYNQTTGNLYTTNVVVAGNVTATAYYGDGSHLTGITATANTGNITFSNTVISTNGPGIDLVSTQNNYVSVATGGNSATAQLLWVTNIGALSPAQLNNGVLNGNSWGTQISVGNTGAIIGSNSVAGLKTWTFGTNGTLSGAGGIIAGNVNTSGTITANVDVSAVGNISGTYLLGNGAYLTGLPAGYGDSNVYALLNGHAANIVPLANVAYSLGNATNQWLDLWVSNATIYMNSVPVALNANNTLTVNGNPVVTVTGTNANIGSFEFAGNNIQDPNGFSVNNGSSNLGYGQTSGLDIPANADTADAALYNWYGNLSLQTANNHASFYNWEFDNTGNLTLPGGGLLGNPYGDNANAAGLQAGPGGHAILASHNLQQFVQADDGNVYVGTAYPGATKIWTFDPEGNITLPSNTAAINYANGQPYGGSGGYGNAQVAEFLANLGSNNISTTGTIVTGGAGGDITLTSGNITGANYATANYFVGDGSQLTNISLPIETGNITFTNTTLTGPSFGNVPSANSSIYIRPTVDSATTFQFQGSGVSVTPPVPFASLTPVAGGRAFINDCPSPPTTAFGTVVTIGGGSYTVPVWSDGSVWRVG